MIYPRFGKLSIHFSHEKFLEIALNHPNHPAEPSCINSRITTRSSLRSPYIYASLRWKMHGYIKSDSPNWPPKHEADTVANQSRLTPLVDRLRAFIEKLPLGEQSEPRSLEFYRLALKGRQGRAAHPGETGEALRSLGFVRKRRWHEADGGFKAVWVPSNERRKK